MQKRAARACCTVDNLFRQDLKVLAVVGVFITQDADRAQPAMADTNDLIAFSQGANRDRPDRRIESRHIAATGENTDHAFLSAHATALSFSVSVACKSLWPPSRKTSRMLRACKRKIDACLHQECQEPRMELTGSAT